MYFSQSVSPKFLDVWVFLFCSWWPRSQHSDLEGSQIGERAVLGSATLAPTDSFFAPDSISTGQVRHVLCFMSCIPVPHGQPPVGGESAKGSAERSVGRSFRFGGGQFGAKFSAKFAAKFSTKFSGLSCWDIQSKETSAKTSALNSHESAQQNWRNFREKLHDEVLQGDPHQKGSQRRRTMKTSRQHLLRSKGGVLRRPGFRYFLEEGHLLRSTLAS